MQDLLLLKDIRSELHVPSTNQFVVYIVKKNFKLKIQRFYQCKCHLDSEKQEDEGHNSDD